MKIKDKFIQSYIFKKALNILITSQDEKIANAVIIYVDKKLQEIRNNPDNSLVKNALNLGLSTLSVLYKLTYPDGDIREFTKSILSDLTKSVLSFLPEYLPKMMDPNLTDHSIIQNFFKNIDDYVLSQPVDAQKLFFKYMYDIQVKINDVIEKVAKDVIINFTKDLIDQYSMGKFVKLFISEQDISDYLEKFAAQKINQQSFIPVKHENAGVYKIEELSDDDWVKVDLGEIPTLSDWIKNRFKNVSKNMNNQLSKKFTNLLSILTDQNNFNLETTTSNSNLPEVSRSSWIVDNDYNKLLKFRKQYVALEREIINLEESVNSLISELSNNLMNNQFIKEILQKYQQVLKDKRDQCYNIPLPEDVENSKRLYEIKKSFEKVIDRLYESTDKLIEQTIEQFPDNTGDIKNIITRQNSIASSIEDISIIEEEPFSLQQKTSFQINLPIEHTKEKLISRRSS